MTKLFRAYTRKSIVEGETASPARQRSAIERRILAAYPDSRIEWYEDLDISGRFEANRPGWLSLLADLESKGGDGVAVESYDRSHRNVKEFLAFYDDILAPVGRTLISATQNIDLSTADGRAMATVILAFAEMESRKASERMEAHLAHLRAGGRHHGGVPFGCDRDPITHHLIPSQKCYMYNPATGETLPDSGDQPPGFERHFYHDALRALFEGYASGNYSLFDLALHLNAAGWRSWARNLKDPLEFQRYTTQSIICRWEIYAGRIPAASGNKRTSGVKRPPMMQAGHPPILPVELCERAGAVLRARVGTGGPKPAGFFLAGGVVYCGTCGVKLSGYTNRSRYTETIRHYYRHGEAKESCPELWTRAGDIHGEITGMVDELLDGGLIEELAGMLRRMAAEMAGGAGGGEIREKQAEMERLISLHVKGLITEEEFTRHRAAIQAEIERLKPALYGQPMIEMEARIARLEGVLGNFRERDPILQKEVIRDLFERIEVKDRKVSGVVLKPWAAGLFGVVRWLNLGPGVSWRLVELMV